jgi:hypothetical protein
LSLEIGENQQYYYLIKIDYIQMDGEEYIKLIQILEIILLKLVVIGDFIQQLGSKIMFICSIGIYIVWI